MKRPLILISNDDGYKAKGIHSLVDMVSNLGDIIVCAPAEAQSGKSRAFSLTDMYLSPLSTLNPQHSTFNLQPSTFNLQPSTFNSQWYSLTGTPVDCIKVAFNEICPRTPDLILGGINHGDNASVNAHYSGTVGIVTEGTLKGVPSIAFSLCDYDPDANFEPMRDTVQKVCRMVLEKGLPKGTFLNVNVPKVNDASQLRGTRLCRMSKGLWINEVEKHKAPSTNQNTNNPSTNQNTNTPSTNQDIYNLRGSFHNFEPDASDTDAWALAHGYVAITPSTIDLTDYSFLTDGNNFDV